LTISGNALHGLLAIAAGVVQGDDLAVVGGQRPGARSRSRPVLLQSRVSTEKRTPTHAPLGDHAGGRAVPGHIGGRKKRGRCPIVASSRFWVRRTCARWPARLSFVRLGWRPGVVADDHARGAQRLHDARRLPGVVPDHEERAAHVQRAQLFQHLHRVRAPARRRTSARRGPCRRVARRARPSRRAPLEQGTVAVDRLRSRDGASRARPRARAGPSPRRCPCALPEPIGPLARFMVAAAGEDDEREAGAARDEQHRDDSQQPPARVSAHPAPTGVECAARAATAPASRPARSRRRIITRPASCAPSTRP